MALSNPPTFINVPDVSDVSADPKTDPKTGLNGASNGAMPRSGGPADTSGASADTSARPADTFLDELAKHRLDDGDLGNVARSIARDACFPQNASYVEAVAHINKAHDGNPAVLGVLSQFFEDWKRAWDRENDTTGRRPGDPPGLRRLRFPPREPILEVAIETGLRPGRSGLWYCWNDVPGSPTQGHFNGNREASLALYQHDQSFFCHQCGIFGWSDQLRKRTWQGRYR